MKFFAALGIQLFRIVQADDSAAGIQYNRGGHHRAKERAATGFVDTCDPLPATLARFAFIPRRTQPSHRPQILAHCQRGSARELLLRSNKKARAEKAARAQKIVDGNYDREEVLAVSNFSARLMRAAFPLRCRR